MVRGWFAGGMRDRRWNKQRPHGSAMRGRRPGKSGKWKRLQLACCMQLAMLCIAQVVMVSGGVTMLVITRMINHGELHDGRAVSHIVGEAFCIETRCPEACHECNE